MENRKFLTEALLGTLFIILSSGLLLYEGFKETKSLAETEVEQIAVSIESGAALYEGACSECHAKDGRGGIGAPLNDAHFFDLGPDGRLAELGWGGTLTDFIVATVSGGRAISTRPQYPGKGQGFAMPAWAFEFGGPLRQDQIRNLAAFILNWEAEANAEVAVVRDYLVPPSEDPTFAGRLAFGAYGCGACHTIDGISVGVLGPNLTALADVAGTRVPGLTAEQYVTQSIVDPNAFIVPDCPSGPCPDPSVMPLTFADQITDEQMQNLLIFLLKLEVEAEGEG